MKYHVWCRLEMEDDVEAETEEEAFMIISTDAMNGGSWDYTVDKVEEDE